MAAKSRTNILLVNGEPTVQHLRALMLRMKGYEVHAVRNIDEARQTIAAHKFDLVVIDVGHTVAPGLEFCEELKGTDPQQKVLLQVQDHLFVERDACPDKIVPRGEGPHYFVSEVERTLQAA